MPTVINKVELFSCKYCGKENPSPFFHEKHEYLCKQNEENKSACCGCKHIENSHCKKKETDMYSMLASKKGLPSIFPKEYATKSLSPRFCDLREK